MTAQASPVAGPHPTMGGFGDVLDDEKIRADIALTYRIGKRGGSCSGLPSVTCSELETDAEDDTDAF